MENFKEKVVAVGTSENECNIDGQACTQHPMAHLFDVDGCMIRIIDTPGIGDPRGVEQDKENLENVITFASNFDEIHGICILLKPNNAKLHTYFRFCILETKAQSTISCFVSPTHVQRFTNQAILIRH